MVEKNCLSQEQKNLMIAGEGSYIYKECVIIFLLVLPITVQYLLLWNLALQKKLPLSNIQA